MSFIDELFEEGFKKGFKIGFEEGCKKVILLIKHWQKGMEPQMIANLTGLTIEEVKKLIADFEADT
jgi:flagellar biosynthesis/type III secretory pathway protein FliH